MSEARELTRYERTAILRLVLKMCANYGNGGCLVLNSQCYMLNKRWTGSYCKYFVKAVLPLDRVLEASLAGINNTCFFAACAICEKLFLPAGRQIYCSAECALKVQRKQQREYMRKKRSNC